MYIYISTYPLICTPLCVYIYLNTCIYIYIIHMNTYIKCIDMYIYMSIHFPSRAHTCKLLVTSLSIAASACSRSCLRCGRSSSSMLACRANKACCQIFCCCCCCCSCCSVRSPICNIKATLDHSIVCLPAELLRPTAAADAAAAPVALSGPFLHQQSNRAVSDGLGCWPAKRLGLLLLLLQFQVHLSAIPEQLWKIKLFVCIQKLSVLLMLLCQVFRLNIKVR